MENFHHMDQVGSLSWIYYVNWIVLYESEVKEFIKRPYNPRVAWNLNRILSPLRGNVKLTG